MKYCICVHICMYALNIQTPPQIKLNSLLLQLRFCQQTNDTLQYMQFLIMKPDKIKQNTQQTFAINSH